MFSDQTSFDKVFTKACSMIRVAPDRLEKMLDLSDPNEATLPNLRGISIKYHSLLEAVIMPLLKPSKDLLNEDNLKLAVSVLCICNFQEVLKEAKKKGFTAEKTTQALAEFCDDVISDLNFETLSVGVQALLSVHSETNAIGLSDINPVSISDTNTVSLGSIDLDPESKRRLLGLEVGLAESIVGQDEAISIISQKIRQSMVLRDPHKPVGSFLLVGHTGVGKTELCKALVKYLYGGSNNDEQKRLIWINCTEYALSHEYAKLIGAPPGYIGHNEGGFLTEALKEQEEAVVLFDEFDKAHEKTQNILFQMLDEGYLTDSKGFKISTKNCIIIGTSNAGMKELNDARDAVGFHDAPLTEEQAADILVGAASKELNNALFNRFDKVVPFRNLTINDAQEICRRKMLALGQEIRAIGFTLSAPTKNVLAWLSQQGYDPRSGARLLNRTISNFVKAPFCELVLREQIPIRAEVYLEVSTDGRLLNVKYRENEGQSAQAGGGLYWKS